MLPTMWKAEAIRARKLSTTGSAGDVISCMRELSTSQGIWFSSSITSRAMALMHLRTSPLDMSGSSGSSGCRHMEIMNCSRKHPSSNIISTNSPSAA